MVTSPDGIAVPRVAVRECDQGRHVAAKLAVARDENPTVDHAEVETEGIERVVMLAVKHADAGFSLEVVYEVAIGEGFVALILTIE